MLCMYYHRIASLALCLAHLHAARLHACPCWMSKRHVHISSQQANRAFPLSMLHSALLLLALPCWHGAHGHGMVLPGARS